MKSLNKIPTLNKAIDVTCAIITFSISSVLACICSSTALGQNLQTDAVDVRWQNVRPGLSMSVYPLSSPPLYIGSEILLFKIDLSFLMANLALAQDLGQPLSDVETMTLNANGIIGINANFFDPEGRALGLILKDYKIIQKLYGIKKYGGIFYIKDNKPGLVNKLEELPADTLLAFQAFPRLIYKSQPIAINSSGVATRRSGIAITKSNEIIIYLTRLRFPGATLNQVQQMLLDPRLEITDALNLDGGGSSQLFLSSELNSHEEILVTGGDKIPVALIFKSKTN
ncbi:MAG: phosphodiester glycosidase family protein [Deltaproteobacteria bacterium]|nr:phosphodiester glycosidase family protein [Deltaproteobacteria bacterium]